MVTLAVASIKPSDNVLSVPLIIASASKPQSFDISYVIDTCNGVSVEFCVDDVLVGIVDDVSLLIVGASVLLVLGDIDRVVGLVVVSLLIVGLVVSIPLTGGRVPLLIGDNDDRVVVGLAVDSEPPSGEEVPVMLGDNDDERVVGLVVVTLPTLGVAVLPSGEGVPPLEIGESDTVGLPVTAIGDNVLSLVTGENVGLTVVAAVIGDKVPSESVGLLDDTVSFPVVGGQVNDGDG